MLTATMSPQLLICDEISGAECESVLEAQNSGVALVASAHGENVGSLTKRPEMKRLLDSGVFGLTVRLERGTAPVIERYGGSDR